MGATTHSIEVNAPLQAVYNQWTQFEEFPRFMEAVEEVRQDGPKSLFWKATIGGKDKQWEAEITEQVPDKRIAWESVDGTPNTGEVTFESLDFGRTRITLTMEYEPEGFLERAGDALGIPSSQVEGDLKRFRDFIEQRETETGSWRGQIENGESVHSTPGINRAEAPLDVKNGHRTIEMESRGALGTETREASPIAGERGTEEKRPAGGNLPLQIAGSESESSDETAALVDDPTREENSQFYREAGALAPTYEQIAKRAYELYVER